MKKEHKKQHASNKSSTAADRFISGLRPSDRARLEKHGGITTASDLLEPPGKDRTPAFGNRTDRRRIDRHARRKLTKSERRTRDRERFRKADQRHLEHLQRRIIASSPLRDPAAITPNALKKQIWAMVGHVLSDPSGRAFNSYARRSSNHIAAQLARRAALVPDDQGVPRYTWRSLRARRIGALALAMMWAAPREGRGRRAGKWRQCIRGIPVAAWCALLTHPLTRHRPSVNALIGRHRSHGDLRNGLVGYIRALEEVGFCYAQQLKPSDCAPFEKTGPSGFACNRYWLVNSDPLRPVDQVEQKRLLAIHGAELYHRKQEQLRGYTETVYTAFKDAISTISAAVVAGVDAAQARAPT